MRHISTPRLIAAGFAATLASASAVLAPLAAADETAPTALADLEKSIVLIETEWSGFIFVPASASASGEGYWTEELTYSTTCTAFFVSETAQLASAGHCVDPADGRKVILEGYITDQDAPDYLDTAITNWLVEGDEAGKPVQRTVFGYQPENVDGAVLTARAATLEVLDFEPADSGDVALLRVPDLSKPTPALSIAEEAPAVGADLTSIGFPGIVRNVADQTQIARASFKTGSASSRQVSPQGVVQIEVNTDLQGGMSGGPTVNEDGHVVGVNSSGFNAAGNFNFVTNTPDLRSFLASNNVDFVEAETAAGPDESSKTGTILIIAGALFVLALIGGGLFLILRRRPSTAGAGSTGTYGGPPPPPHFPGSATPNAPPPMASAGNFGFGPPPPGQTPRTAPNVGLSASGGSVIAGSPPMSPGFPPSSSPQHSLCRNCGAEHEPDEKFCPQCGYQIG